MSRPLTAEEAIEELRQHRKDYGTPDSLRALAGRVDADAPGRITALYSGPAAKGVWSTEIINAMVDAGEDVRVINKSEAAAFLSSRDFIHAVAQAHGIRTQPLIDGSYRGPAADWLYHPEHGPWADASARFADATKGEVVAIVGDADPGRVFGKTEVPHILANPNVTTIEGIPRETLAAMSKPGDTQAAFEMIVARAREHGGQLRVPVSEAVNYRGQLLRDETGRLQVDSRDYFEGTVIEGKTPAFEGQTRALSGNMNPPTQYAIAGQQRVEAWQQEMLRAQRAAEMPDTPRLGPRLAPTLGGAAVSAAVTAYEWNDTHQQAQVFRNTLNNDTAAQDAYVRQGAQTTGAAVGTLAGGVTASVAGLGTGGTFALVAAEGYLFATVAERAVEKWQQDKIYTQTDRDGVYWQFNGRQWLREDLRADLVDDGRDATQRQSFSALPDKARELSAMASAESVKQALADAPEPRNPFVLPADDSDRHSLRTRNWNYEPETGKWLREVVTDLDHREMPSKFATIEADPARAAQLSAQAMAIIDGNLKAGPASIAAQYEIGHRARGYEQTVEDAIPPAVTTALDPDLMQASDGKHYRRDAQGAWTHADQAATPTRALELELTRERLLPALEQHRTQLADMPTWQPPTPQQQDRANLRQAYLDSGLNPDIRPERFEAAYAALQRTRAEHGIGPENTSLTLDRDASGKFSMDSPIQHLRYDANGVVRIAATTTPEQIAVAAREAHAPTPAQDTAAPAAREAETLRQPERSAPAQDALPASPAQATDIRDERHLGHTRYLQALDAIERSPNIPPGAFQDERLHQAAANLAWTSLAGGERAQGGQNERLERIDFAVLNTQRDGLIAGQGELGNPTAKLAFLPAAQDNATTLAQSSQQVHDSVRQQREQVQMPAQQAPAPTLDDPGSKGPRLA